MHDSCQDRRSTFRRTHACFARLKRPHRSHAGSASVISRGRNAVCCGQFHRI
jgi:hypothetical protein